jgi:hypothetical protein
LPHWTTPERSAARYELEPGVLRLRIDADPAGLVDLFEFPAGADRDTACTPVSCSGWSKKRTSSGVHSAE